jgi:hypothetical protein
LTCQHILKHVIWPWTAFIVREHATRICLEIYSVETVWAPWIWIIYISVNCFYWWRICHMTCLRKNLDLHNHDLLIWHNVFTQPDVKEILKQVEDYMERDRDNANLFKYLAWFDLDDKLLPQLLQIANKMMKLGIAENRFLLIFLKGEAILSKLTSNALLYIKSKLHEEFPFLLVQYYSCNIL